MEKKTRRNSKKVILAVLAIVVVVLVLTVLLLGALAVAWYIAAPAVKYNIALECIENGDYGEAYVLLRDIRGYEDSENYLAHFYVASEKETEYTYPSDGEAESEVTLHYISEIDGYYYDFLEENTDCKSEYTHDENGNVISAVHTFTDGRVYERENVYGDGAELTESTFILPDVRYTVGYGENGNIEKVSKTFSDGSICEVCYDAYGRVTAVTTVTPEGEATSYEDRYDNNGNIVEQVSFVHGKVATGKYIYNTNGNLIREVQTAPDGNAIEYEYSYDANGKLAEKVSIHPDGNITVRKYTYDTKGNVIKEVFEAWGEATTLEYSYDSYGNMLKDTIIHPDGGTTVREWAYDDMGRLIKETYISSLGSTSTDEYAYDGNGRMIKEVHTADNGTVTAYEYSYDGDGKLIKKLGREGDRIIYYEYRGLVLTEKAARSDGYDALYSVTAYYIYDLRENKRLVIDVYDDNAIIYVYNNKGDTVLKLRLGFDGVFSAVITDYDKYGNKSRAVGVGASKDEIGAEYKRWEYEETRVTYIF